jgi:hypothetical protein
MPPLPPVRNLVVPSACTWAYVPESKMSPQLAVLPSQMLPSPLVVPLP